MWGVMNPDYAKLVYLHGASGDLVIIIIFHQAVRVVNIVLLLERYDFLIDYGKKARYAIDVGIHWFCSSSSQGLLILLSLIHLNRYCLVC